MNSISKVDVNVVIQPIISSSVSSLYGLNDDDDGLGKSKYVW
jgi:hypothetical protein